MGCEGGFDGRMSTRVMITHPPAPLPRYNLPRWQSRLQVLSRHLLTRGVRSHGRMMCNDNTPPPPASMPRLNPLAAKDRVSNVFLPPSHPRGDHAPCSQVTCDSPSNPAHHARPLVSALPPREAARSTATLHRKRCPLTPQRAEARTTCELRVTVTPAPSCKGHSTSYRSLRASRVTDCARATAMVVKRKTRNEGNTHHTPVVPRVQPLLKCAPSCCVRTESLMDERPAATTLNVACS